MVRLAVLDKHEARVVVPLPNKRLEAIKAALAEIRAALAAVAPGATPEQLGSGSAAILAALPLQSNGGREPALKVAVAEPSEEWASYPPADGTVFDGWKPGLAGLLEYANSPMAHVFGPPPRYAREIMIEAVAPDGRSSMHALQVAARRLHGRRKTTPGIWQAYTVLRVARDLRASATSDGQLSVYEKNGEPGGKALAYVRAIHAAVGRRGIGGSRWPAAYVQAYRLIQATDRRFVPARSRQYPRLVVKPYVDDAPSSVGQAEGQPPAL